MRHDPRKYLWDARRAADLVMEFTADADRDRYHGDLFLRSAVERQFEIIGEALHQLSRHDQELARRIPDLPRIVAFRNRLIHGYSVTDHEVVWNTVTNDLPALRHGSTNSSARAESSIMNRAERARFMTNGTSIG